VALDDTFHVTGRAVTDFHGITVEDFVEFVVLWKVFINKL